MLEVASKHDLRGPVRELEGARQGVLPVSVGALTALPVPRGADQTGGRVSTALTLARSPSK